MFDNPRSAPSPPASSSSSLSSGDNDASSHRTLSVSSSCSSMKKQIDIPRRVRKALSERDLDVDSAGVVRWKPDSRSHPRKWSIGRKTYDTLIICFLEFFMTLISNSGAPVADVAHKALGISETLALFIFITLYLLGQAIGGLLFPPVSESCGSRIVWVSTTFGYAIFCLIISIWSQQLPVIIVGRFMSGLLSAIPATVATGSLENLWDARARIFVIHMWISSAVLGLAFGPPVATYISASEFGWPFVYGIAAIVTFALGLLCFLMKESRPEKVLQNYVGRIKREQKFTDLVADGTSSFSLHSFVQDGLWLPARLFFKEPILAAVSFMGAYVYALIYMFSEALSLVYVSGFGISTGPASLVFAAFAVGIIPTFLPRIYDIHHTNKLCKQGKVIQPEDKLFGFFVAAPIMAVGLWWFAFTIPPVIHVRTPWPSIFALVLVGYGVVEFDNVLSGYLTDSYNKYAASANAPMAFLRCILSGVFPLFGRQMFQGMGTNWAVVLLAVLATGFCGIAIWFHRSGKRLRQRSPFAEGTASAASSREALVGKEKRAIHADSHV